MSDPLRPLGVGEIIGRALELYRRDWATLVRLVAVVVVPFELVSRLVSEFAPELTEGSDPGGPEILAAFSGLLLVALLDLVSAHLATAATFKAVSDGYLGRPVGGLGSLRHAHDRLASLLLVALLGALLIAGGFVLLVVPGIYLAVALSMAIPVVVAEDRVGRDALARSRDLVRGRWWPAAGTQLLAFVLAGFASGLVFLVPALFVGSGDGLLGVTVGVLTTLVAGVLTMPFTAAVLVVLYVDLRVRKEGLDVAGLARSIGVEPPPDSSPPPPPPPPPPPRPTG